MSLDDSSSSGPVGPTGPAISFLLSHGQNTASFTYLKSQLQAIACRSSFLCGLATPNPQFVHQDHIDLSEYKSSSFTYLMDSLINNKSRRLTDDLDIPDLNRLIRFMGIELEFEKTMTTDTETLFDAQLTVEDRKMRSEELALRQHLYSHEDEDLRSVDATFEFSRVASQQGYQLEKREPSTTQTKDDYAGYSAFLQGRLDSHNPIEQVSGSSKEFFSGAFSEKERPSCPYCPEEKVWRDRPKTINSGVRRDKRSCYLDDPMRQCYITCEAHGRMLNPIYKVCLRKVPELQISQPSESSSSSSILVRALSPPVDTLYPSIGKFRSLDAPRSTASHFVELFNRDLPMKWVSRESYRIQDLDFTDICIAGGAVLKTLLRQGNVGKIRQDLEKTKKWRGKDKPSDIDFFLTTKDPERAKAAIDRILTFFRSEHSTDPFLRSKDAISFAAGSTRPSEVKIQIILRLYNSVSQVISGFDVDSCCVAYDGRQLYAMPRFIRALRCGYNLADPDRQSTSYHARLYKYLKRGFAIAIPGYDESRVVPTLQTMNRPEGLAKVVAFYYKTLLREITRPQWSLNALKEDDGDYVAYDELNSYSSIKAYITTMAINVFRKRVGRAGSPAELMAIGEMSSSQLIRSTRIAFETFPATARSGVQRKASTTWTELLVNSRLEI